MKKTHILIMGGIVLVLLILITGSLVHRTKSPSPESVTMGAMLILSGPYATYGERAHYGIEVAVNEYNQDSSHKTKVRVVYEDTKGDAKTAVAAYQKLVSVDHVDALVGPLLETEMSAVAPLAVHDKVPLFGISIPSPDQRTGSANPLGLWPDPTLEAGHMADYAYSQGIRTVAVVGTRDSWEQEVSDAFAARFAAIGGTVTSEQIVLPTDNDLHVESEKAIQEKPQAVFLGTYFKFYQFLKDFKQLNYSGRMFSIEVDTSLAQDSKNLSSGLQFISPGYYTGTFEQSFKALAGYEPSIPAAQAHDAAALFLSLYHKGDTQSAILAKMASVKSFAGASGLITFTPDHRAVFPLSLFELQDGTIVPLTKGLK